MDEFANDLNEDLSLSRFSFHEEQPSSSNAIQKGRKPADNNSVPWRFCLSQLAKCKDLKNRTQFKKLIGKYAQAHAQQRKSDTLLKAKQIWPNLEDKYGDLNENWQEIEADLFAREGSVFSFVNILIKADPSTGVPCRAIRRVNGVCKGHPEHNVQEPKDPRTRHKKVLRSVPLLIPNYPLDDYVAFAPPRREIAFIELNDNVKEEYLRELCCGRGKRELNYLQIYTHPTTGSHLGMALAEFKTTQQAMDFYDQCGLCPKIMGFFSKIFVDTLGFWITDEFARLTGSEPTSLPPRRYLFKDEEEIKRIRELILAQNIKDDVFDNQERPISNFQNEDDLEVENLSPKLHMPHTPIGMPNSSSASANSLSRSVSRDSIEQIDEVIQLEISHQNGRSPSIPAPNIIVNGNGRRKASLSPRRSHRHSSKDHRRNGHSTTESRRREDSRHHRDRSHGTKRRLTTRDDRRPSKYRRREMSISPDRTKTSHKSRKRSVSSSSSKSGSSDSYKHRRKRTYKKRERSISPIRRSESRSEKLSEISLPADPINLCVQPPPAPYDLTVPFLAAYPPPFFQHFYMTPIEEPTINIDSIPCLAEDAPVRLKSVERELGPYFVFTKEERSGIYKQMQMSGYYNEHGIFVLPTLRLYEEPLCSFLVTDFYVEYDASKEPIPIDPRITAVENVKEKLKNDLLQSLKASMCQKIETLMYKEVDRLHVEYEEKQKILNEERSKIKRPETKQIFDFEQQFGNNAAGMGTKSVFGSNRTWQLNRNLLSTKKIPKKNEANAKPVSHKKSIEHKMIKKENKRLKIRSRSASYKSPSPAMRPSSRTSSIISIKKSSQSSKSSSSSSLSSSSSDPSSSDQSDTEEVTKKSIQISASSSSAASRNVSPKAIEEETEEDRELQQLQITQSRTLQKVDYCEDNSSESEGDSDWADEFGIPRGQEGKKSGTKTHKKRPEDRSSFASDESRSKEQPKKRMVVKEEESTELVEQEEIRVEPIVVEKKDLTPEPLPVTISVPQLKEVKEEPPMEVDPEPIAVPVQLPIPIEIPQIVELPKPIMPKPKIVELPKENVQLFPNTKFAARNVEEEERILHNFVDEEDSQFIMLVTRNKQISITQLSTDEQVKRPIIFYNPFTSNADLPPVPPSPKPSKNGSHRRNSIYSDSMQTCVGSNEGAARLIPYVRGKPKVITEKNINYGFIEVTRKDERAARNKQEKRRELRALQRNLVSTVGDVSIVRQNVFKFREKMLKFARSGIHGWGLFTLEDIQPNDMIIEYVGEVVRPTIADVREFNYTRRGIGSSYLFRMDDDSVVDATGKGNVARFINHSCNPNCFARVIGKMDQRAICIYAKRFIRRGEEITYDYLFPIEDNKIPCHCGSPVCRLYLN